MLTPRISLPPEISSEEVTSDEADEVDDLLRESIDEEDDPGDLVSEDEIIDDGSSPTASLDGPPIRTSPLLPSLDLTLDLEDDLPNRSEDEPSMSSTSDLIRKSLIDPVAKRLGINILMPATGISVELAHRTSEVLLKKRWLKDEAEMRSVFALLLPTLDPATYTAILIEETDFETLADLFIAELARVPPKEQPQRHVLSNTLLAAFKRNKAAS